MRLEWHQACCGQGVNSSLNPSAFASRNPRAADSAPPTPTPLPVASGILLDRQSRFLMTSRPEGKPWAGYWEFPGGKLEAGEDAHLALRRELREELGIEVLVARHWRQALIAYATRPVLLDFFLVTSWAGGLQMREGQRFAWCEDARNLPPQVAPVLPGAAPALQWLGNAGAISAAIASADVAANR